MTSPESKSLAEILLRDSNSMLESKSDDDDDVENFLKLVEKEKARTSKQPQIDKLDDAIVLDKDGNPQFLLKLGDSIIIERYTDYGSQPRWFDTKVYEIKNIDTLTGAVRLFDLENKNYAATNYITGFTNNLHRFKIAPSKANKLKRRGNKKVQQKYVADEPVKTTASSSKKPRKMANGLRRVYDSRGTIHTRITGVAYGPSGSTKAKDGDRLTMVLEVNVLKVTDTASGWTESWKEINL